MSNTKKLLPLVLLAVVTLVGCHQAESPAAVEKDVAKAADSAATNNAKALEREARTEGAAENAVAKAVDKADTKVLNAEYDAVITAAEGDHKIELARCNGLAGDLQQACKDKADAALQLTKANAKISKTVGD